MSSKNKVENQMKMFVPIVLGVMLMGALVELFTGFLPGNAPWRGIFYTSIALLVIYAYRMRGNSI